MQFPPGTSDRANDATGRGLADVPVSAGCPFISRFVECQNTSFIYRRLAFFQDVASSADEKRVYYAIRLEVTRSEGGSPIVDEYDAGRRIRRCLRPRA